MMGQGQQMMQDISGQMQQGLEVAQQFVEENVDAAKTMIKGNKGMSEEEMKRKKKEAQSKCPPDPAVARIHFKASLVRQTENLNKETDLDPLCEEKDFVVDDYFTWFPSNSKQLPLNKDITDGIFSELGVGFCEYFMFLK